MSEFIKLTKAHNGEPVWIRKDAISSIQAAEENHQDILIPWE